MANSTKEKKFKYWAAVSYPNDSEPQNFEELAKIEGIECCCIVHDKDYNETEKKAKKLHRHWIFAFPNTTTIKHATSVIQKITNGPEIQGISNVKGAYAYLTHKHDPDKAQYDESDILCFCGFAPTNYFSQSSGEEDEAYKCIEKIIKEQDIEEYCCLVDFLNENYADLARFARTHTIHIKAYLQSKHMHKRQKEKDELRHLQLLEARLRLANMVDPETGELIKIDN